MTMSRLELPYQAFRSVNLCRCFLTMAEVAEVEDDVVIIDCEAIFYEGGEHYRNKNKVRCRVSRIEKRLVKLNEKIWEVCLLPARRVRQSR